MCTKGRIGKEERLFTENRESDLLAEGCFQAVVQHLHRQSGKRYVRKGAWERSRDDWPRTGRVIY